LYGLIGYDTIGVMNEALLKQADVALLLGISEITLKRMRLDGKGPAAVYLSARTIRYNPGTVTEWIENNEEKNNEGL